MDIFRASYRRFWIRNAASSGKYSLTSKTEWAIHNKGKFEDLLVHLKDFIDRLHDVVPIRKESQDQIIRGDTCSILDLSKLCLVQSACSEANYHQYQFWSDMASAVIQESTDRTIGCQNVEEWIRTISGLTQDVEDQRIKSTLMPVTGKA